MNAAQLLQSAEAAKTRYQFTAPQRRDDLETARNDYEALIAQLPEGHEDIPKHKIALCDVYLMLGEFTENIQYNQRAVELATEAVNATAQGDPVRVERLLALGSALEELWVRDRDEKTGLRGLRSIDEAIVLAGDDHPALPSLLTTRGLLLTDLVTHVVGENQLARAREAVECQAAALQYLPEGDPRLATVLRNYAKCLVTYNELPPKEEKRLDDAVAYALASVRHTPLQHYHRHRRLGTLAMAHYRRWRLTGLGATEDMHDARRWSLEAVACLTPDHQAWRMHMFNLSASMVERYELFGSLDDLDSAISTLKRLMQTLPEDHPHFSSRATYLGKALVRSFRNRGLPTLLDDAIEYHEKAVRMAPPSEEWRCRQDLGEVLLERFLHQRDPTSLSKAVQAFEAALEDGLVHQRDQVRANLANALATRYASEHDPEDLERALQYFEQVRNAGNQVSDASQVLDAYGLAILVGCRGMVNLPGVERASNLFAEAIATANHQHPSMAQYYCHYGVAQRLLYRFTPAPPPFAALEQSISALRKSVQFTRQAHPLSAKHRYELAISLLHRLELSNHPQDAAEADALLKEASDDEHAFIVDRWTAAKERAKLLHLRYQFDGRALDAYQTAISLLPRLAWLGLEEEIRYETAQQWLSLGNDAANYAIACGRPDLAIEYIENSRSVLWNQLLQLGESHEDIRRAAPALVDELDAVGRALEANLRTSFQTLPKSEEERERELERAARARRRLAQRWDELVQRTRTLLPQAHNFLGWSSFNDLRQAAAHGPVVVINSSQYGCHGLIITARYAPAVFSLQTANIRVIESAAGHLITLLSQSKDMKGLYFADREIMHVLHMLWKDIGHPLWRAIQSLLPAGRLSRVWLMPTGALASLPLHAAMSADPEQFGIQDVMIPSYTPTLTAMIRSRRQARQTAFRMLAVGCPQAEGHRPLPCWHDEKAAITRLFPADKTTILQNQEATVDQTLRHLPQHNFVHFCCHGEHDWKNPYQSHLALWDGKLTLRMIAQQKFSKADFAFLSACHTARVDPRAPDESVHLASGVNLAGFRSIIATMWGIVDKASNIFLASDSELTYVQDAPVATNVVYSHLTRDNKTPDPSDAAEALHLAIKALRRKGVGPIRWAPFIHIGL